MEKDVRVLSPPAALPESIPAELERGAKPQITRNPDPDNPHSPISSRTIITSAFTIVLVNTLVLYFWFTERRLWMSIYVPIPFGEPFTLDLQPIFKDAPLLMRNMDTIFSLFVALTAYALAKNAAKLAEHSLAHLWKDKADTDSRGAKTGKRSLNVFRSLLSSLRQTRDILKERPLAISLSVILLQVYPLAFSCLAYTRPSWVQEPITNYSFVELPFMEGVGSPWCSSSEDRDACVASYLVASAHAELLSLEEAHVVAGDVLEQRSHHQWLAVETPTDSDLRLLGYLGPYNGVNLTEGLVFFGSNVGTVTRILGDPSLSLFNSFDFEVRVNTTLPILTVQCAEVAQGDWIMDVTISNSTYHLPRPVPVLYDEEVSAQITQDGRNIIFSFQSAYNPETFSNIHCAVGLRTWTSELVITTDNVRGGLVAKMTERPWEWDVGRMQSVLRDDSLELAISEFGRIWLKSMDWSALPTPYALAMLDTDEPVRHPYIVGASRCHPGDSVDVRDIAEYASLSFLANSVAFGFANESTVPPPDVVAPMAQREIRVRKMLYKYVQSGTWYRFCALVLGFNSLFAVWSVFRMLRARTSNK
ncbi:hypothetical protein K474DRAFT_1665155 [Panus rudis PR-1116 ss-1]|nr:hypothetical protein K474DRAFT_1665155 [Panus rudis PR-1116 ss-1]